MFSLDPNNSTPLTPTFMLSFWCVFSCCATDWPLTDWRNAIPDVPTRVWGSIGDRCDQHPSRCGRATIDGIGCSRVHAQRALRVLVGAFVVACPSGEVGVCGSAAFFCFCLAFSTQCLCAVYYFCCIVEGSDFDRRWWWLFLLVAAVGWLVRLDMSTGVTGGNC